MVMNYLEIKKYKQKKCNDVQLSIYREVIATTSIVSLRGLIMSISKYLIFLCSKNIQVIAQKREKYKFIRNEH